MYLVPLNYDPFFKKIFSDVRISKRFLEDFLNITIQKIELLPLDTKITNKASFVSFDFRCKIDDQYVIIDMQQWYKSDIVKRFYVYHALDTVLQLEIIGDKSTEGENLPKTQNLRNYDHILPVITIVWLVSDTLGFTDDYISYSPQPDAASGFIYDHQLWQSNNLETLLEARQKCLKILDNNSKNIHFMKQNKLIYAFQKNIVKNTKHEKYYEWFEFAERSLKKNNQEADFDKYRKDEVFMEIMRRLQSGNVTNNDFDLIDAYEQLSDTTAELEQEKQRAEQEKQRAEQEKQRAEQEKQRAEQEKQRAEQEKQRAEQERLLSAKTMKNDGMPIELIARYTGFSVDVIEKL
ncbi:MAG: hypothetical protein KA168_05565 [Chitinophagales bacterium]|nr:hypothetical protein [Chitinophagales bacterium]